MSQTGQIIVLHSLKYRESSLIVYAYSPEGRKTFLLKGVRKSKSHDAALFFPMSLLDVQIREGPQREMLYLREYRPSACLHNMFFDVRKNAVALFMGEWLYKCLREESPDPDLFRFIQDTVLLLNAADDSYTANLHLFFVVRLCHYLGYEPINDYDSTRPYFSLVSCSFTAAPSLPPLSMDKSQSYLLHRLLLSRGRDLDRIAAHGPLRTRFLTSMLHYYELRMEKTLAINSLRILSQVF